MPRPKDNRIAHANIMHTPSNKPQGIVTIPGRELQVPQLPQLIQPMPTVEEQGLCIGATFALAATNVSGHCGQRGAWHAHGRRRAARRLGCQDARRSTRGLRLVLSAALLHPRACARHTHRAVSLTAASTSWASASPWTC
jgi:hypothetical protein